MATTTKTTSLISRLYFQLLIAIVLGVAAGAIISHVRGLHAGDVAQLERWDGVLLKLKLLGDLFIKLIKMLLAPIIFCTVAIGIARMRNMKTVGRVGVKALVYFEVVSSFALIIGLVVVNLVHPGVGMNSDLRSLDAKSIATYTTAAKQHGMLDFFINIIPSSVVGAFVEGNMLQVILFSVLFGISLSRLGDIGKRLVDSLDVFLHAMFGIVRMVMRLAPLGAFGAMAFTIGKFGLGTLAAYGRLIACVYFTSLAFIVLVLGVIAWWSGLSLWRFLRYIRDELLIVFGTFSTEAVLPQMMTKLENLGCERTLVGMVLPAGYTFNADGTSIYLTMAAIFVAQATNTPLSLGDQLVVLAVLLLTSKGSAGVAGAGFVTLAATLSSMDKIPVAGLALLLGVESFINLARAITNLIGNGVATVAIARWEGAFDKDRARQVLAGEVGTATAEEAAICNV
jgi:DAACS family dicarboxylate/amino acid:cation (Na+ or H+) symporter/aerobic C4-dicarboxylate transport protein